MPPTCPSAMIAPSPLASAQPNPTELQRIGDTLLYLTADGIRAFALPDGPAEPLVASPGIKSFDADEGDVFYTVADRVERASITGGPSTVVASGLVSPTCLASVSASTLPCGPRNFWSCLARTSGFPLLRHSVFFSRDYRAEFDNIFTYRQMPAEPTVYVCAQDRDDRATSADAFERLFILINAPANGDRHRYDPTEISQCARRTFALLERCGLTIETTPELTQATTPADFHRLFPGTGGALYGRSSHGWMASFRRPGSRSRIPGLYLAGGSVHPGPGVPMAAMSGRLAAEALTAHLASTKRFHAVAISGGTSTR